MTRQQQTVLHREVLGHPRRVQLVTCFRSQREENYEPFRPVLELDGVRDRGSWPGQGQVPVRCLGRQHKALGMLCDLQRGAELGEHTRATFDRSQRLEHPRQASGQW